MNVLSLFAGIGGLDLGLERAGMTVVGQVEKDPYCRRVLARQFPGVPQHDDARNAVPWWRSEARPHIDLVAGGFPCQPVSVTGNKRAQEDPRWLWPYMHNVITDLRPEWVLFENVLGLRQRGLNTVLADLTAGGYVTDVRVHSACAVGAPHMRRRLFGLAHRGSGGCGKRPWHGAPSHGRHEPTYGCRWDPEPRVDRVAHGVPNRVDRIRGLGNAVVPQVAEDIGGIILAAHRG